MAWGDDEMTDAVWGFRVEIQGPKGKEVDTAREGNHPGMGLARHIRKTP